jgi:hypothetical protein
VEGWYHIWLADLKESNPVRVSEYSATKNVHDEPAFVLWAPYILNNRNRIIDAATKRYHKSSHKFGIQVPNSWDEALKLDKENNNTMWKDAISKEMKNVRIVFNILNGD